VQNTINPFKNGDKEAKSFIAPKTFIIRAVEPLYECIYSQNIEITYPSGLYLLLPAIIIVHMLSRSRSRSSRSLLVRGGIMRGW
jgi:hypothetical protein